jgi:MarR family transcriptional regulator, transcriptional regulator for hemolysin
MRKLNQIDDETFIFGALFMVANKVDTLLERELNRFGVTSRQWFLSICTATVFEKPPTLKELAGASGTSYQNVKQVALKLQLKNLMRLRKDPKDARVTRVELTPESAGFWASTDEDSKIFMTKLYQGITPEEFASTRSTLEKLMDNLATMEEGEKA